MDILLVETGNGGDVIFTGNDLAVINGFENMPYLAMFGGNVEEDGFNKKNLDQLMVIGMDIEIIESDNGGDIVLNSNDISIIDSFENMPYLAMFGGNPGYVSKPSSITNSQNFDFWGNNLFMVNSPENQFNSYTEESFKTNPLNISGKAVISEDVSRDLSFLDVFGTVSSLFEIITVDKVSVLVELKKEITNGDQSNWWGNDLLMEKEPSIQFVSGTEKSFENINLSKGGLLIMEQIITNDLQFMQDWAPLTVTVKLVSDDKIDITVNLQQPTNEQDKKFQYLWEGLRAELLLSAFAITSDHGAFDFSFDLSFN
jgi:hypothetical protein